MYALRRTRIILLLLLHLPVMAMAQTGGLRYTVTVARFENKSAWVGQWDLGDAWTTVMTDLLQQSGRFIVVGDSSIREQSLEEQDSGASGRTAEGSRTPVTGHMTPAQLLLKGAITHVQHDTGEQNSGIHLGKITVGGKKQKSEISATILLVDSTTGQVVASTSVTGVAKSRRGVLRFQDGDKSLDLGGAKNDNLFDAISNAAGQSIEWLVAQLPSVSWSGTVVTVMKGDVVVNRGTREGVQVGQIFRVGTTEILRSPDTGEILDQRLEPIAEIEVTQVKPAVSYCKVISGDERAVRKGLSVQPPSAQSLTGQP